MRYANRAVICAAFLVVLSSATAASAPDTLFVSSFTTGEIYRFDLPAPFPLPIITGLTLPEDGACHPDGRIYFAESVDDRVTRWQQDGTGATNIVPTAGLVFGPEGLSIDSAGNLYMNTRERFGTASGAWRIDGGSPSNPALQVVPPFSDFGEGSEIVRGGPHEGALLLVDRGLTRVLISEPPGAPADVLIDSSNFPSPGKLFGVVSDGCGNLLVSANEVDSLGFETGSVLLFDPEGDPLGPYADSFGGGPLPALRFMELDSAGNLYVGADPGVVYRVLPDRTVEEFSFLPDATGVAVCREGSEPPPCIGGVQCDAGGPYEEECRGNIGGTLVHLDGSGSSSLDGGTLTYSWSTDCPGVIDDPNAEMTQMVVEGGHCDLTCLVSLEVVNEAGQQAACESTVRIFDSLPPDFDAPPDDLFDISIWPPSHGYVVFSASEVAPAADACGTTRVSVAGCASNQPEEVHQGPTDDGGNGDGRFFEDCVVSEDGSRFAVRAERLGACGPDAVRVYTLELVAEDECGQTTGGVGHIRVEHDRAGGRGRWTPPHPLPPNAPPPFPYLHPTVYGEGCGD